MKYIKNNFLVISDYNWLPENIEDSWVDKLSDNYLIYDRYHRFEQSHKIKHQKNVGQNIYDIFDFIVENYNNLPENTLFCRACIFSPKDTGTPRLDEDGNRLSNGTCTEEFFMKNCNNNTFTELQDFTDDSWRINGTTNNYGPDNSYCERNDSWYLHHHKHPGKYYTYVEEFLKEMYKTPKKVNWFRFAPGGSYIIPKSYILKHSKKFYEEIRRILSYDIVIGEAHMIERCLWLIFNCDWEVNEKYK